MPGCEHTVQALVVRGSVRRVKVRDARMERRDVEGRVGRVRVGRCIICSWRIYVVEMVC